MTTTLAVKQAKRYSISRRTVADAQTPFIRNCWYVAAESSVVTQDLTARTLLGEEVLFYRDSDGESVALSNRCPHRSYPLDKGKREGDDVVCGYHGLRFGPNGFCKNLPGQGGENATFAVRSFPVIEKGGYLWIWMGDPGRADPELLPDFEWLDHPDWEVCTGYLHVEGSYVHMHENLLDLSHLSYLHASTFGTPEYALAPIQPDLENDRLEVWRDVECILPPIYSEPLGWVGDRALRRSGSEFVSPALHVNTGIFTNLDHPEKSEAAPMVRVAQLLTPETATTMHYHFALCRNFALGRREVGEGILAGLSAAFKDISTDRVGLAMRKRLKKLADAEDKAEETPA